MLILNVLTEVMGCHGTSYSKLSRMYQLTGVQFKSDLVIFGF